jgi:hypothetical protein
MNIGQYKFELPLDWGGAENEMHRRHSIGKIEISDYAVDLLNQTIEKVDVCHLPLSPDQIVSCGRQLLDDTSSELKLPLCIFERFRTLALMDAMVKDFDWQIEDIASYRIEVIMDYVKRHEELIPHDAPIVGHLDDVILVEAAKNALTTELENYVDYRRLRKLEAYLQGMPLNAFTYYRENWLESREAEQALIRHQRENGLSSYRSGLEVRIFKVH